MVDGHAVRRNLAGSNVERAVSPVIGVILMVAITVVLAAVIATFVAGISPGGEVPPNSNLEIEYTPNESDDGDLSIIHNGGDELETADVTVSVQGDSGSVGLSDMTNGSNTFGVGDVASTSSFDTDGLDVGNETVTVQVVHEPSDGSITSRTVEFEE